MARAALRRRRSRARRRGRGERARRSASASAEADGDGDAAAMQMIPIIELCRYCPGMVTALGVSVGLTARRDHVAGHDRAEGALGARRCSRSRRSAPGRSPSRARAPTRSAAMKSTARRDGDGYVLNGSKTFITNGPYADTIVFICKLDEGNDAASERKIAELRPRQGHARAHAVEAAAQDGPALVADRRAVPRGRARRQGPPARRDRGRAGALRREGDVLDRSAPASPRWRSASSSSASSSASTTRRRACSSASPIGEFQLIQLKLAKMEVARMNIQNLVFRQIEMAAAGQAR